MYTTYILLINRSLLTGLPFFPFDSLGVSVHISLTFSSTMLQWRSNALTRARSFRLLRQEIRTCVWLRTAVWRIDKGPALNSCSSRSDISYSLFRELEKRKPIDRRAEYERQFIAWLREKLPKRIILASTIPIHAIYLELTESYCPPY